MTRPIMHRLSKALSITGDRLCDNRQCRSKRHHKIVPDAQPRHFFGFEVFHTRWGLPRVAITVAKLANLVGAPRVDLACLSDECRHPTIRNLEIKYFQRLAAPYSMRR
jgi:hypothetical protein